MEKTDVCMQCPLRDCESMGRPDQVRPDILFLGGYPVEADIRNGPFTGKNSSLLRSVAENMKRRTMGGNRMRIAYGYSALCAPPWDESARKYQINADIYKRCAVHILEYIDEEKPKAIVCLGTDALHALGFKGTEKEYRGSLLSVSTKDGEKIPVVATFHIVKVAKDPGILPTFQKDLGKAFALAMDGIDHESMHLETPVEFSEVMELLSRARAEIAARHIETGKPVALAVDTETSSLEPYNMADRVIAVSLSWKAGQGVAFPFEHRAHPYSAEELSRLKEELGKLLSSPDASLVMANGKFDMQWLAMHYRLPMNKVFYDTMLAEHILDEDKKGEYSLKALTKDRFPSMGRYEKELQEYLASVWEKKEEKIKALRAEHREREFSRMVSWWVNMGSDERFSRFSSFLEYGYVDLEDSEKLLNVKTRRVRGQDVPLKAYEKALVKLLRSLPEDVLKALGLREEFIVPEELSVKSFEDADLGVLLKYAAIDALTTRMVCADQIAKDFPEDKKLLARVERTEGKKPQTVSIYDAMRNITMPMCEVLAEMEYNGVRFDRERGKKYQQIVAEAMEQAKDEMFQELGRSFNTSSSSPDLRNILYKELGLPVLKMTDKGDPSTDADTLKQLSDEHDIPFLQKLLKYRKWDKCLHTYLMNWDKMSSLDGKIHCSFHQIGTASYRLSSSNPNLQ